MCDTLIDLYSKIPMKNKNKEIIDYALVDNDDYKRTIKYKWQLTTKVLKDGIYKCVSSTIDNKTVYLSHFILGKPSLNHIVDHIDNNGLNNYKSNLRFATKTQNSQNKKKKKDCSSKYIGVYYHEGTDKWKSQTSGIGLGTFENEIDAGIIYDKYIYITLGEHSSTNGLVKYEDVKNLKLEDILPKNTRDIPKNISKNNNAYYAKVTYKKKTYRSSNCKTIEEALEQLKIVKQNIANIKKKELLEHNAIVIQRNNLGQAIINLYDINKKIVGHAIVDDDKWHDLMKYSWSFTNGYVQGYYNGKMNRMHRLIMNAKFDQIVDHINGIRHNNLLSNLRFTTNSANSHNKISKNKYKGVYKIEKKSKIVYIASIHHNGIQTSIGHYINEDQAAFAYNMKAIELYHEFASLNEVNISEDIAKKYESEILEKWNKPKNSSSIYFGVTKEKKCKSDKWKFQIQKKARNIYYYSQCYDDEILTAIAYNIKANELLGEDAKLNNIDEIINIIGEDKYNEYINQITKI
jgi:hypothetical protein